MLRVVLDTNVLVAGLLSTQGASFAVLTHLGLRHFIAVMTTSICFEYEDVISRPGKIPWPTRIARERWLDTLIELCEPRAVQRLIRPLLRDPKDDMFVEAAVAGSAALIVTHNLADFRGCEQHGIKAVSPARFLAMLRQS